ncbi:MAG: cofactor-independent phosphoglycerate mutase [Spirochaetes bacterium]|jgi:2,3-bisphosphoglycerate-independent phosphoglycerate mutase|nr:cofactor-independent phosphoglycerate mutase [Spirochaetota bacterium]
MSSKYLVIIGDGMADLPIDELDGKTILEAAAIPHCDSIAAYVTGLTQTVPEGMPPGSDTANLSIFGYNPRDYYTGRAPLEALNQGITLGPDDMAFRMNLVSIRDNSMSNFTADHIESEYASLIVDRLNSKGFKDIEFYAGVSYRNLMVWRNYPFKMAPVTIPPHDIQGKIVDTYRPLDSGADRLAEISEEARKIIAEVSSQNPSYKGNPTDIWIWGAGRKPALKTFAEKFSLTGKTVSAVDLIHGIGRAAGLSPVSVDGATGYLDTNYEGKTAAALASLQNHDFVFLHIEAPDETGHEGSLEKKMRAVEDFDKKVVGPMLKSLAQFENYTVLVMPDHPTPISVRTHTPDPVPFAFYSTDPIFEDLHNSYSSKSFSEKSAKKSGLFVADASHLLDILISKNFSLLK